MEAAPSHGMYDLVCAGGMVSSSASGFDVRVADYPDPRDLKARIVDRLDFTGYCVVDLCSEYTTSAFDKALAEANELSTQGCFVRPPSEVVNALLGEEGSAWICKLDWPGVGAEPDDKRQTDGLKEVIQVISELGTLLEESVPVLGFEMGMRTDAIIHEAGNPEEKPPALTPKDAQAWLDEVTWHRLMCMAFLGPGRYPLQMQPFYGDGSAKLFHVEPGSVVLLRPEVLSHTSLNAQMGAKVVTCWYLSSYRTKGMWGGTTVQPTPTANKLSDWIETQVQLLVEQETEACPLEAYRVLEKGVMKLEDPHPQGNMVDVVKQGDIVRGVVKEVRRNDYWLEIASEEDGASKSVWMPTFGADTGLGKLLERLPVEAWRVKEKVVFRLQRPEADAPPVGMAKEGEIVRGYSSIRPDGSIWVSTMFVDEEGFWTEGWLAVIGTAVGRGKMLEKMSEDVASAEDLTRDMMIRKDHMYSQSLSVCVRTHAARVPTAFDSDVFYSLLSTGLDATTVFPTQRFEFLEEYYDPDPDNIDFANNPKTTCKHGCYIEGAMLFDSKAFNIPIVEAAVMSPEQRIILELSKECFVKDGLLDKDILKQPHGVYIGGGSPEFVTIDINHVPGGDQFKGTGASGAIFSNRVSYVLGVMGPSITFECDSASSHIAMEQSYTSFDPVKPANPRCLCIGEYMCIYPLAGISLSTVGLLSSRDQNARCRTFDDTAQGFIRADGLMAFQMAPLMVEVDGNYSKVDDEYAGLIINSMCGHVGGYAKLYCPSALADMEVMGETIRRAKINPVSIDVVECNGEGRALSDATESMACLNLLRLREGAEDYPLSISAVKTQLGHPNHGAGMEIFLKVIQTQCRGTMLPLLHLRRLNPDIDFECHPGLFLVEPLHVSARSSIVIASGRSMGGTIGETIFMGHVDEAKAPQGNLIQPAPIRFWTGGGGEIADNMYEIAGSFNGWCGSVPMKKDEDGLFTYTMMLGVNGFEHFQIWLDGNPRRVLHPGQSKAAKEVAVLGPDEDVRWNTWMIDGRTSYMPACPREQHAAPSGVASPEDIPGDAGVARLGENADREDTGSAHYAEVPNTDAGRPGDFYQVRLHISGRWHMVAWDKLSSDIGTSAPADVSQVARDGRIVDKGTYFVAGSWNQWTFNDQMAPHVSEPGRYSVEIRLMRKGGEFQIVRDRDWVQVMYPQRGSGSGGSISGPDDADGGLHWSLKGKAGDVFRIDFYRTYDGKDSKRITWQFLRSEPLTRQEVQAAKRKAYAIVGSWDGWEKDVMHWDGKAYKFRVDVGPTGKEHFQILLEGEWGAQYHPSVEDANPYEPHRLVGPGPWGLHTWVAGLYWTIGEHEKDCGAAGQTYEIELHIQYDFPSKVSWRRLRPAHLGVE